MPDKVPVPLRAFFFDFPSRGDARLSGSTAAADAVCRSVSFRNERSASHEIPTEERDKIKLKQATRIQSDLHTEKAAKRWF